MLDDDDGDDEDESSGRRGKLLVPHELDATRLTCVVESSATFIRTELAVRVLSHHDSDDDDEHDDGNDDNDGVKMSAQSVARWNAIPISREDGPSQRQNLKVLPLRSMRP